MLWVLNTPSSPGNESGEQTKVHQATPAAFQPVRDGSERTRPALLV
jgi:hypothetical protein